MFLLFNIQEGYVQYLETANILSYELISLQRQFQDAVAAADEEMLEQSSIQYDLIKSYLDSAHQNTIGMKNTDLVDLTKLFDTYYNLAVNTSRSMIKGEFTEELSNNITKMVSDFNEIKSGLDDLIKESGGFNNI